MKKPKFYNLYDFNEKGYLFLNNVYSLDTVDQFNKEVIEFMKNNDINIHLQKRNGTVTRRK
jgi:hypothetical protein